MRMSRTGQSCLALLQKPTSGTDRRAMIWDCLPRLEMCLNAGQVTHVAFSFATSFKRIRLLKLCFRSHPAYVKNFAQHLFLSVYPQRSDVNVKFSFQHILHT